MVCASWPSDCNLCQMAVLLQLTQSGQACPLHGRHPKTASLFGYKFWGDGGFLITQFPDMKVDSYHHQRARSHQQPLHTHTPAHTHILALRITKPLSAGPLALQAALLEGPFEPLET